MALMAALISIALVGGARSADVSGLIAFTRPDGIYVMQEDGTGVRPLRTGPVAAMAFALDWSLDGGRLAFESGGGLWVMDADGKDLIRVVAPRDVDGWEGGVHSPSWSPDGRRIAFTIGIRCCSKPRYEKVRGIWVVNADGGNLQRLLRLSSLGADRGVGSIDWSPDGRRFAFTSHSGWIAWVYVVDTDGTNLRRLTGNPAGFAWAADPHWSPDGRRIVFEQTYPSKNVGASTSEIYVMDVDRGVQVRLTRNRVADNGPVWSSDGRQVVFVRFDTCTGCPLRRPGDEEIIVATADGTGATQLTHNDIGERSPAWQSAATP
jgi:Tol biopolymer transport system component